MSIKNFVPSTSGLTGLTSSSSPWYLTGNSYSPVATGLIVSALDHNGVNKQMVQLYKAAPSGSSLDFNYQLTDIPYGSQIEISYWVKLDVTSGSHYAFYYVSPYIGEHSGSQASQIVTTPYYSGSSDWQQVIWSSCFSNNIVTDSSTGLSGCYLSVPISNERINDYTNFLDEMPSLTVPKHYLKIRINGTGAGSALIDDVQLRVTNPQSGQLLPGDPVFLASLPYNNRIYTDEPSSIFIRSFIQSNTVAPSTLGWAITLKDTATSSIITSAVTSITNGLIYIDMTLDTSSIVPSTYILDTYIYTVADNKVVSSYDGSEKRYIRTLEYKTQERDHITIDRYGRFLKDGQLYFPLIQWVSTDHDQFPEANRLSMFQTLKDSGFTAIHDYFSRYPSSSTGEGLSGIRARLDDCATVGLDYLFCLNGAAPTSIYPGASNQSTFTDATCSVAWTTPDEVASGMVATFKNHPALMAYMMYEEPENTGEVAFCKSRYAQLKNWDKDHFVFIDHCHRVRTSDRNFMDMDSAGFTAYPYYYWYTGNSLTESSAYVPHFNITYIEHQDRTNWLLNKPNISVLESYEEPLNLRTKDYAFQAYMALITGARGIDWFRYSYMSTDQRNALHKAATVVSKARRAAIGLTSTTAVTADFHDVKVLTREHEGKTFILAGNGNTSSLLWGHFEAGTGVYNSSCPHGLTSGDIIQFNRGLSGATKAYGTSVAATTGWINREVPYTVVSTPTASTFTCSSTTGSSVWPNVKTYIPVEKLVVGGNSTTGNVTFNLNGLQADYIRVLYGTTDDTYNGIDFAPATLPVSNGTFTDSFRSLSVKSYELVTIDPYNIHPNPGFETGTLSGWTSGTTTSGTVAVTSAISRSEAYSVAITPGSGGSDSVTLYYDVANPEPGYKYTMVCWYMTSGTTTTGTYKGLMLRQDEYISSWWNQKESPYHLASTGWTSAICDATPVLTVDGSGLTNIRFNIYVASVNGTYYVDDISIRKEKIFESRIREYKDTLFASDAHTLTVRCLSPYGTTYTYPNLRTDIRVVDASGNFQGSGSTVLPSGNSWTDVAITSPISGDSYYGTLTLSASLVNVTTSAVIMTNVLTAIHTSSAKPSSYIDSNNNFMLNGSPWLPIGLYNNQDTYNTASQLDRIASSDFNTVLIDPWTRTYTGYTSALTALSSRNLKAIMMLTAWYPWSTWPAISYVNSGGTTITSSRQAVVEALVDDFKSSSAMVAWFASDETYQENTSGITPFLNYIRANDNNHPAILNIFSNQNGLDSYRDADIASFDYYPHWSAGYASPNAWKFARVANRTRQESQNGPMFCYLELGKIKAAQLAPHYKGIVNNAYHGIINGFKGFLFYSYSTLNLYNDAPSGDIQWADVKPVATHLKALSGIILGNESAFQATTTAASARLTTKTALNSGTYLVVSDIKTPYKFGSIAASGNTIVCSNHGFSSGTPLKMYSSTTITTPLLSAGTTYYVTTSNTSSFSIATTSGGSSLTLNPSAITYIDFENTTSTGTSVQFNVGSYGAARAIYKDGVAVDEIKTVSSSSFTDSMKSGGTAIYLLTSSNLVLDYDLQDVGPTITDYSNYANSGTASGATRVDGPVSGYVYSFDGDDCILAPSGSASLNDWTQFSLETWAYIPVADSVRMLAMKGSGTGATNDGWYFCTTLTAGNTYVLLTVFDATRSGKIKSTALAPSSWYHIVTTFSGSGIDLYLNGVKQGTTVACTGHSPANTYTLTIGRSSTSTPNGFNNKMGMFRCYNNCLTSGDVVTRYAATSALYTVLNQAAISTKTVNKLETLTFTASSSGGVPPYSYSLSGNPTGATITSGGSFSWLPTYSQGPSSYTFNVVATDALSATDVESVTVNVSSGTNLLTNGNVDSNFTGWTPGRGNWDAITIDSSGYSSGCAKIDLGVTIGTIQTIYQQPNVPVAGRYLISFMVKTSGAYDSPIYTDIRGLDVSGNTVCYADSIYARNVGPTGSWTLVTAYMYNHDPTISKVYYKVGGNIGTSGGQVWFDNLSLIAEQIPVINYDLTIPKYRNTLYADEARQVQVGFNLFPTSGYPLSSITVSAKLENSSHETQTITGATYASSGWKLLTLGVSGVASGSYHLNLSIGTSANSTLFVNKDYNITITSGTTKPTVYFDQYNRCIFSGTPFFPIVAWTQALSSPSESGNIGRIRSAKFNTVMYYSWMRDSAAAQTNYLSMLATSGLKFMAPLYRYTEGVYSANASNKYKDSDSNDYPNAIASELTTSYQQAVTDNKSLSALLGWHLEEECTQDYFSDITTAADWVKENDANHPLWPVHADNVKSLEAVHPFTDVVGYDKYPVYDGTVLSGVTSAITRINSAGLQHKPLWQIIECGTMHVSSGAVPTSAQIMNMCFQAIINGARGLFFYPYHYQIGTSRQDTADAVATAIDGIKHIALGIDTSGQATTTTSGIQLITRTGTDSKNYILAVNLSTSSKEVTFINPPYLGSGIKKGLPTETQSYIGNIESSAFTDTIPATGYQVYEYTNYIPVELGAIGNKTINEHATLTFTGTASYGTEPYTFTLSGAPSGASITSGGIFTWTPNETQGGSGYTFNVIVTDATSSDSESITVSAIETNTAPTITYIGDKEVNEEVLLTFTASASDSDVPTQTVTFSLLDEPSGATITSGGLFEWTPTTSQGTSSYTFKIVATDNGTPNLSGYEMISVLVKDNSYLSNLNILTGSALDSTTGWYTSRPYVPWSYKVASSGNVKNTYKQFEYSTYNSYGGPGCAKLITTWIAATWRPEAHPLSSEIGSGMDFTLASDQFTQGLSQIVTPKGSGTYRLSFMYKMEYPEYRPNYDKGVNIRIYLHGYYETITSGLTGDSDLIPTWTYDTSGLTYYDLNELRYGMNETWTQFSKDFILPSGISSLRLTIILARKTGYGSLPLHIRNETVAYIDNITFNKVIT